MPKKEDPKQQPKTQITRTDVGCIIHRGATNAKLQLLAKNQIVDKEFRFYIKFVRPVDDKLCQLSTGEGLPISIKVQKLHQGKIGFFVAGEISQAPPAIRNSLSFGGNRGRYADIIPQKWFQPGYQINFVNRGAVTHGFVIDLTTPDGQNRLKLYTKNL